MWKWPIHKGKCQKVEFHCKALYLEILQTQMKNLPSLFAISLAEENVSDEIRVSRNYSAKAGENENAIYA